MQQPLQCILLVILSIVLFSNVNCQNNFSPSVQESIADSGIQISYTESSFTNIFKGIASVMQNEIRNQTIISKGKIFSLFVTKINLNEFQLNTTTSQTQFLSDNQMRITLNFDEISLGFNYKLLFFEWIPIQDQGCLTDTGLQLKLDVSISSNVNGTTRYEITHLNINAGKFVAHLDNKILNFLANLVFNVSDLIFEVFKEIIDTALEKVLNKLTNQTPTQVKIPGTDVILDLSMKGQPFLKNGYMNIPISGNSYHYGQTPQPLEPFRQFDPTIYTGNSTQIFVDLKVIDRILETFISKQLQFNITLPQTPSSTTPVDSRSLSAVFPGLRKLKTINFPIIEVILNSTSVQVHFKGDVLRVHAIVGANLYMQEANKPETQFKYNNEIAYVKVDFSVNILNSQNFLTVNLLDVDLQDVYVSPLDEELIDLKQIISVFPFFDQIIHDIVNFYVYQQYLNLSKMLGFDINRIDINFEDTNIHLDLIF